MAMMNFTNTSETQTPWYTQETIPDGVLVVHMTLEMLIIVSAVFGNSLVIGAYVACVTIRMEPSNVFIIALAVLDITTAIVSVPVNIFQRFIIPLFWRSLPIDALTSFEMCIFAICMKTFPTGVGYVVLVAIAVDRFVFIVFPLRYAVIMTRKRCLLMVTIAFVFQAANVIWLALAASRNNYSPAEEKCEVSEIYLQMGRVSGFTFGTFIPIVLIISLHSTVALIAYRKKRSVVASAGYVQPSQARGYKITIFMLRIVVLFLICNLPVIFVLTAPKTDDVSWWMHSLKSFFVELVYLNSALNPLVYAKSIKTFSDEFKKLLRVKRAPDAN